MAYMSLEWLKMIYNQNIEKQQQHNNSETIMKNPKEVHLRMKTAEGKFVDRSIDITNLLVHRGSASVISQNIDTQRNLLEGWIEERGNEQHGTTLTLISWTVS